VRSRKAEKRKAENGKRKTENGKILTQSRQEMQRLAKKKEQRTKETPEPILLFQDWRSEFIAILCVSCFLLCIANVELPSFLRKLSMKINHGFHGWARLNFGSAEQTIPTLVAANGRAKVFALKNQRRTFEFQLIPNTKWFPHRAASRSGV